MIFLDIETATQPWDDLPEATRGRWEDYCVRRWPHEDELPKDLWDDRAALMPEFGLVCCVSYAKDDGPVVHLVAQTVEGEKFLLSRLSLGLDKHPRENLCAHNGKGFDYHYLARRLVIQRIKLPEQLNTMGKKPWEVKLEDTQEMWGFGDMRRTCSLDLLCHVLGVESPKEGGITGKDVPQAWRDGRVEEIAAYCDRDVEALRNVYRRLASA